MEVFQETATCSGCIHRWEWSRQRQTRSESGSGRMVGRRGRTTRQVSRDVQLRPQLIVSNLSERVPGELQTNNRGELLSVIRALETCPFPHIPLEIRTDSQYTIMCMTVYLPKWLRNGFLTASSNTPYSRGGARAGGDAGKKAVKNADMIKHLLVLLRRRDPKAMVRFKYVPGHAGVEGNEGADRLARMGAAMPPLPDRSDWLDPDDMEVEPVDTQETSQVDVEIDESWLMTPDELSQFEKGFTEEV
ncbi:ribonuclease H-like domain-containing protein [Papiliotrema laurentii]|uniref:ribonuclease H n=1 Tax=Papiliotrema laurentii TaxID=5418 RepID=A0AAD9FWG6_PAPLA|nr:ribonuclease H-like domain-containing protein [Papiliotrema laurentii]